MTLISRAGLLFYGTIKLIFVAIFSISLNFASNVYAGEEVACAGSELLWPLANDDPEAFAMLRKQADRILYGNSRLWKISKPGLPDSWVFGTMHMADANISALPQSASKAYENSKTILVEITDMLDPDAAKANIFKLKHLTFRLDGSTIDSDLNSHQMRKLKLAAKARGLPYELAIRMQPWMLAPAIGNQLCEIEAKKQGKPFLDAKIMNMALEDGKELIALETTEEQLTAISSMPWDFQIKALVETLELGDRLDDIRQTMKRLYIKGDIGMIVPALRHFTKKPDANPDFTEFQDKLVDQRNVRMVKRANEYFQKGNSFMAVGAMHLPGITGIISLLEQGGYQVQAVETPLF
ncbi:MAG: TraB/GumN family protein [Hyphomicrobiales bacterium]|nr:TraB/GumN family protein [Hyphomicrobiales bacterium]